ncbi:MAG: hypothetical protein EOP55_20635, partial [Sphingobacteriales bacterium]
MRNRLISIFFILLFPLVSFATTSHIEKEKSILVSATGNLRVGFGVEKVLAELKKIGYPTSLKKINANSALASKKGSIIIGQFQDRAISK